MDPEVVRQHIDLYVNGYTLELDEGAVRRMVGGDDPFAYQG